MMTPEEKLVLEGGKVKVLTQGRQLDNAEQSGVIVDYLRFTIKRDSIPASRCVPPGTDDQNLAKLFALQFANLLGYTGPASVDGPKTTTTDSTGKTTVIAQHERFAAHR